MKITYIRIDAWPEEIKDGQEQTLRINIEDDKGHVHGFINRYPIDYLESSFDRIWRDIGETLKRSMSNG